MRTVNPKAASLRHASREVGLSREHLKKLVARREISCVNADPLQFDMDVLRAEIKRRNERIIEEMWKGG